MEFVEFGQIIETMVKSNYPYDKSKDELTDKIRRRKDKSAFSIEEHIEAMVFAELSNQRPWETVEKNAQRIREIFHGFETEYLKSVDSEILLQRILQIRCGNLQIKKQLCSLKENVKTLERIERENGGIDVFYDSMDALDLAKELSGGKRYKLKRMGLALVSEYLKNVGIDIIKPDLHVCRILGRLAYTKHAPATVQEAYDVCAKIAKEYGLTKTEVDSVLWQFGAKGYFEQCGSKPKCGSCLVGNCKSREWNLKKEKYTDSVDERIGWVETRKV